jgi:predicted thioesterase
MIAYMEITAMELLQEILDEEHTTVGTIVNIRHLAPSPLGAEIKVKVEITHINGAKISLKVDAWDGETLIGTGDHGRYVINIEQFKNQLGDRP